MKIFKYKHTIKTKRRMFSIGGESLLSLLACSHGEPILIPRLLVMEMLRRLRPPQAELVGYMSAIDATQWIERR
jgi:hypothetical protein